MKCRSSEILYHANNVAIFELVKENSFLQFKFFDYDKESYHLKELCADEKEKQRQVAAELSKQGMPNRKLGKEIGKAESTVRYWLKKQGGRKE
jgi:hypothetical protein